MALDMALELLTRGIDNVRADPLRHVVRDLLWLRLDMLLHVRHERAQQSSQIYLLLHVLTGVLLQIDKLLNEGTILLEHLITSARVLLNRCVIIQPLLALAFEQTQLSLGLGFLGRHDYVPAIVRWLLLALFELLHVLGSYVVLAGALLVDGHDALVHALAVVVVMGRVDDVVLILWRGLAVVLGVELLT